LERYVVHPNLTAGTRIKSGPHVDYPGLKCLGLSLEDMSHPEWFISDPCAAWGFYGHRMKLYLEATPHQGFAVLRQILRIKGNEYFVFTSNIDSHFQKAGFQEQKIYEAHGVYLFTLPKILYSC